MHNDKHTLHHLFLKKENIWVTCYKILTKKPNSDILHSEKGYG